jgi:hypothetical protein
VHKCFSQMTQYTALTANRHGNQTSGIVWGLDHSFIHMGLSGSVLAQWRTLCIAERMNKSH